jgi:hypothetical protein
MNITLQDNEKQLILVLLDKLTIKPIDKEAILISMAAQSLLSKLLPQPQLEVVPESTEAPTEEVA